MKRILQAVIAAASMSAAAACGSSVQDNTLSTAAGTGGGTSTTATSSAATSSSTGAGGNACAAYADQAGAAKVTVHFENQSGMAIYVPADCATLHYEITPQAGPDGTSYTYDASCLQTCEDLQSYPQAVCGACAPIVYLLPPGGSRDVVWDGTGLKPASMPVSCYADPTGQLSTCPDRVAAPAGTYGIQVTGYSACEGGPCTCDAQGQCSGSATGAMAYADPITFSFPSQTEVDVIFGVCAFGCAGD